MCAARGSRRRRTGAPADGHLEPGQQLVQRVANRSSSSPVAGDPPVEVAVAEAIDGRPHPSTGRRARPTTNQTRIAQQRAADDDEHDQQPDQRAAHAPRRCEAGRAPRISRVAGIGVTSRGARRGAGSVRAAMTRPAVRTRPAPDAPPPRCRPRRPGPASSTNCTYRSVGPSSMGRPSPLHHRSSEVGVGSQRRVDLGGHLALDDPDEPPGRPHRDRRRRRPARRR